MGTSPRAAATPAATPASLAGAGTRRRLRQPVGVCVQWCKWKMGGGVRGGGGG